MSVFLATVQNQTYPIRDQFQTIEALTELRQEWEAAAEGESLLDVTASVGLMLADVATKLGMIVDERAAFLGSELNAEITALVETPSDQ